MRYSSVVHIFAKNSCFVCSSPDNNSFVTSTDLQWSWIQSFLCTKPPEQLLLPGPLGADPDKTVMISRGRKLTYRSEVLLLRVSGKLGESATHRTLQTRHLGRPQPLKTGAKLQAENLTTSAASLPLFVDAWPVAMGSMPQRSDSHSKLSTLVDTNK